MVFLTFVVILVTLVGQGLTLPALVRALRIPSEREWSPEEAIARLEAAQTALDRLDELEDEQRIGEEPLRRLRDLYRARFRQCMAVIGGETQHTTAPGTTAAGPPLPRPPRRRRAPSWRVSTR